MWTASCTGQPRVAEHRAWCLAPAEEAANGAAVNSQAAMQGAPARPLFPAAMPHGSDHEGSDSEEEQEEEEEQLQKKKRKKSPYHPIQAVSTLAPIILSRNGPPGVDPPKEAGVFLKNLIWPHFSEDDKDYLHEKLIANRAVDKYTIKDIYDQQPEEVRASINQLFWRAYLKSKSAVPPNQQDAAPPNSPSNKQPAGKGRGAKKAASANTPVPAQGPRQTRQQKKPTQQQTPAQQQQQQQQQPMEPEESDMQKASRVLTEAAAEMRDKRQQLESAAQALSAAEAKHAAAKAAFLMAAYM